MIQFSSEGKMGRPIVYCDACGVLLRDEEFERGRAFTVENRSYCLACRPEGAPAAAPRAASPSSSQRIPVTGATPRRALAAVAPPRRKASALPWIAVGGAVGLVGLLALASMSAGPPSPPEPPAAPRPAPPSFARAPEARSVPPPAPREAAADERQQEAQRDRFCADVRGMIREAKDAGAKRAEIEGRIRGAEQAWGKRKDFDDLRAELEAAVARSKAHAGLVGHWPLDAVVDGKVADLSPNGLTAAVKGKAKAVPGRIGGGLEVDGVDGHVELPVSGGLKELQRGSYTLAVWYRPAVLPAGASSKNNKWAQGLIMRPGYHEGLLFRAGGLPALSHWLVEGGQAAATGATALEAGRFLHLAGVVDHEAGEIRVYVDGRRDGRGSFAKGAAARDFGGRPWLVGIALPGGKEYRYAAKGILDDVRIYERALTDDEVKALFSAAK
jgi:hypothetical protein